MSNLSIFFVGNLFSGFGFELLHQAFSLHIFKMTGSVFKFSLAHFFDTIPKMLILPVAGIMVDKFKRKTLFVLIDLIQAIFLLTLFIYLKNFGVGINSFFLFTFIAGAIRAFSYPATKAIVPLLAKDKARLKASSFEISNDKIAKTLAPVTILIFASKGIEVAILVTSIFYFISAFAKSFLVVEEAALKKENIVSSVWTGVKTIFEKKVIVLALVNAIMIQLFFHTFFNVVLPPFLKASNHAVLPEWMNYIMSVMKVQKGDVYLSIYAFLSITNAIGVFMSMFFFQMFSDKYDAIKGMKVATYLLVPLSAIMSFLMFYFVVLGRGGLISLTLCLIPLGALFFFAINTYTVYFSFFYQAIIPHANMGRFVGALMTLYMAAKSSGYLIYGEIIDKTGFLSVAAIFTIVAIVNVVIFNKFEKENDNTRL